MNETYTTIDTFSIEALNESNLERPGDIQLTGGQKISSARQTVAPVIARIPDINAQEESLSSSQNRGNATKIYSRIDQAAESQPTAHTRQPSASNLPNREVNAFEAIRSADHFLGSTTADKDTTQPASSPPNRDARFTKGADSGVGRSESLSDLWLLQAEAAIVPFTKWIVLAVVLAALALALVLVQGSRPETVDPTDALLFADAADIPQSEQESINTGLLEPVNESTDIITPPSMVFTSKQSSVKDINRSTSEGVIVNRPVGLPHRSALTVASEKDSASKNQPQAELVGRIVPIEPYRTTNTRVANQAYEAPAGYPTTQKNGLQPNPNGTGSQLR